MAKDDDGIDRTPVYCFGVRPGYCFYSNDGIVNFRFFNDSGKLLSVTVEPLERMEHPKDAAGE